MKRILNIIGFIVIFCIIYIAITNADIVLNLQMWGVKDTAQFGMPDVTKSINLALYTLIVLAAGLFTGVVWVGQFYFAQKEKLTAYKRELEKSSITNSSSTSRVEVLEAKIATLEKALDDALNK